MEIGEQRNDLTQSFEDLERVLEDYMQIIPPDNEHFLLEKATHWFYDDIEEKLIFYFDDEWALDEFQDKLLDCPGRDTNFAFEEWDHVDRKNLTITVIGKLGGLIG